jgi:hypothetical protein
MYAKVAFGGQDHRWKGGPRRARHKGYRLRWKTGAGESFEGDSGSKQSQRVKQQR